MDRHINAPLDAQTARELRAGDYVYITGTIYTARDAAHLRMDKALNRGEQLPVSLENNIIYYMGPSPAREGRPIGSAGPTTASRMDKYAPRLLDLGLKGMIGKGKRSDAVKEAIGAGIKTVMITGDHKTTAAAIAKEIGIMSEGDISLTGKELDALSEKELKDKLEHITVYARVSPENKIRIVKAWQEKGYITAMTGDGVNDAPALKQANIGIGMGSGTDVAKDASAMILTDDNFSTIVSAIEVGRTVYSNIKKAITYLFAGNLGAIIAILFAVFVNWPNPFTALQLLFINLINDSLPAIALGLEEAEPNIMKEKPRDINESILAGGTLKSVILRGLIIGVIVIIAQYVGDLSSPALGAAMAFSTVTLARIFQTLPARSNDIPILKLGVFKNKYAIGAIVICLCLYSIVLIPGVRGIFNIPETFGWLQFGICLGLSIIAALIMDFSKFFKKAKV